MKTIKQVFKLMLLLFMSMLISYCSKDSPDDPNKPGSTEPASTETKEPTKLDLDGNGDVSIVSDNIVETDTGYKFNGMLKAKNDQGEEYNVVEGDITIEVGDDGAIISITGEGSPKFPNIGNFKSLLEGFDMKEAVKSHIEFETGSFYKTKYQTKLPLADDIKYFHFEVLNEEAGNYELKSKINDKIHEFAEYYLDPADPAVFYKIKLPDLTKNKSLKKSKKKQELMDSIFHKASQKGIEDFGSAAGDISISYGYSNQGLIPSRTYEFSKPENFQQLFGFSGFESLPTHLYQGIENIPMPIPYTGNILKFSGETFFHYPINQLGPSGIIPSKDSWANFFNDVEVDNLNYGFTGSIAPSIKALGMIMGVLPKMNDVLGYEIFGKDINMDIVAATEQGYHALLENESYLRFGGELRTPIIADILGTPLKKFINIEENAGISQYFYYSLGSQLEDWKIYLETDCSIGLPHLNDSPLPEFKSMANSYFALSTDGLKISGTFSEKVGPLELTNEVTGSISPEDGLELTTLMDREIALSNGFVLQNTHLETSISTTNGIKLQGFVNLPFGIVDADTQGELGPDGISMTGSFSSDITLPDGTKIGTYGAGLEFGISTNPEDGISLSGFIDAPAGIGSVEVVGYMKSGELYLHGNFDGNVDFKGVNLYTANGEITISSADGFKISGAFDLPITSAELSGFITNEGIEMVGGVTRGLTVAGNEFTLSNSLVSASSATGVQIAGNMNLYFVQTNVSGSINPDNSFSLSGTVKKNLGPWDSTINTTVTQSGVSLSGSGCLDVPIIGRQCQSLSFQPNWAAKTVRVCRGAICYTF
ncbi:hypothetical protein H4O18_21130 [Arenibacter sp. BSSL-BM3]|uniref:Autotransporter-associated beta strand repeat-containing protein n=1 Tax=Arenibacter arenosicollis TaxID=2762274 RepID=A0ABR7QTK4_9FLAO|nr:hypothetical protein [Arenibacter arenosicollis]MBC8770511.1 hypothetical protein [Arenibacter arenosicollis]